VLGGEEIEVKISKSIVSTLLILLLLTVSLPIIGTESADEAQLIGVSYDQGVDTDSDLTFDYLVVGVAINVVSPGYYEVQISGLSNSNSSYISVWGSNSSYLNAGAQVFNVSLNGEYIYESGLNPRYVSYIYLYGGVNPWERNYYGSLANVPLTKEYLHTEFDPSPAKLTGRIIDQGIDSDGDGGFNFLEICAEVNVSKAGYYTVSVYGLQDLYGNWIDASNSQSGYLEFGLGYLNVSLSGYRIRNSHLNPLYVSLVSLYSSYSSHLSHVELSHEYSYMDFDAAAVLTGVISDKGVDSDGDGKFNSLELGVQVDVFDAGTYDMSASGLLDSSLNFTIDAYASQSVYLDVGLQFVYFSLDGTRIFTSNHNPKYVGYISLNFWGQQRDGYFHDEINQVPLSKQYSYTEFDPPRAMLTGKIYDLGVDNDADGFFDFLQIGVELNVTETGTFWVSMWGLNAESENPWPYTIDVSDYAEAALDPGIRVVNLYTYGPRIYVSHHDPANVTSVSISDGRGYYQGLSNIPLSKVYSYKEFDAPFWDAEAKVVVYPDGRVSLEGSLMHTHMIPENTGPTATGFLSIAGSEGTAQTTAGLDVTFPQELASQFPYNSTTAKMLAAYSNGILNLGANSTLVLPPGDLGQYPYYPYGQWPFNATDGSAALTYSGGILNLEINGETTLPPAVKSQFPFNATDLTVAGSYAANTLDGTITFSVSDDFTFDDVKVDFTGTRTGLILNGSVTVVFGVQFGGFIAENLTDLEQQVDVLRSTVLGESGIVWNMTGGLLNVTDFDVSYSLLDGGWGAKVTFEVKVQGDFVQALAHLVSNGRNPELLYQTLDEAYSSAKDGAFMIDYKHDSSKAAVELTFSYDLKGFVDNALTTPPRTSAYALTSYTMYPALSPGDVVFVEPVSNHSDILADPTSGDIIAFHRPDYYNEVIVHRAINRTVYANGTLYFQTKGDNNGYPDPWLVPEHLIIGKVVRRVPLLGYLLLSARSYLFGYYGYQNTAAPLELGAAAFSSLQEGSVRLSYSSVNRLLDLKLTVVYKLKELVDNVSQKLPDMWPPETPPEVKEFFEKLLNTTYASVSSAQFSSGYQNGVAEFDATVIIEGDLNKEINYVKDLYIQLYRTSVGRYNASIPWQFDFIDQTGLDLSKLKVTAQLGETSFEGRIQGVTIIPPREVINATHFTLKQLFNFTAPQNSWQREFPTENQRLRITIAGGTNATHMVTLYAPPSVPEPDTVGPYEKSMTWFNQTFSSLKGLILEIGPRLTGTLTVETNPVTGEVFVNNESWGSAPQSRVVDVGFHDVSFGDVTGYRTPQQQLAMVYADEETIITGAYVPINGTLTITTTPVSGEVIANGVSWGRAPQSRVVQIGTYIVSFGSREGYSTPASITASVSENEETSIEGVYQAIPGIVVAEITEPELVSVADPFIIDAIDDAAAYIVISEISHPITVIVKNITESEETQPPPNAWKFLGNCVQITTNNTGITVNATIRIYYTLEQLEASGLDESTLTLSYWDAASSQWTQVESNVNTGEHYVWAIVDHFSTWVVMGQLPSPMNPLLYLVMGIVLAGAIIAAVAVYSRKRRPR
jgi:signal peptidase I